MASSTAQFRSFWREFSRHKMGLIGAVLLLLLIATSVGAAIAIPLDTFKQWHNPTYWSSYPKTAAPLWVKYFTSVKPPEHKIMTNPEVTQKIAGSFTVTSLIYAVNYDADLPPDDFMFSYALMYRDIPPLIEVVVKRPDDVTVMLSKTTGSPKPQGTAIYSYNSTLYSTDRQLQTLVRQSLSIPPSVPTVIPQKAIFAVNPQAAASDVYQVLKGTYLFNATFYTFSQSDQVVESKLILGGKVFGVLGTDDLRRDLFIGIVWGTPIALAIGVSVATLSVFIGLVYGVLSGYKGRKTDEVMMRFNDVIFALPALPFLIILTLAVGKSVIFVVFYLVLFGWVGIAKVARSIALQIKTQTYVEASELTGASSRRVIFKHIIPQIMPYTFASIALSVPSAILTEAGLSFLGLGDPTLPTWGQLLHDAQSFSAAARGIWWWVIPPGAMIALAGLAFVLIGSALDAILNPKMRRM